MSCFESQARGVFDVFYILSLCNKLLAAPCIALFNLYSTCAEHVLSPVQSPVLNLGPKQHSSIFVNARLSLVYCNKDMCRTIKNGLRKQPGESIEIGGVRIAGDVGGCDEPAQFVCVAWAAVNARHQVTVGTGMGSSR